MSVRKGSFADLVTLQALGQAMRTWPNLYGIARLSPEILDMPS